MGKDKSLNIIQGLEDFNLRFSHKYLLFCTNLFPFIHIVLALFLFFSSCSFFGFLLGLLYLYFIPPLLARVLLRFAPIKESSIKIESTEFIYWWILLQLQMVFSRLFFLEELLRMVPGLYSLWLRSWGSKVGSFVIWSPGVRIYDRTMLEVGSNVVFGAGARISAHLYSINNGERAIMFDKVVIGDNVVIGGYSLIGPGVVVHDGELTDATLSLPPYSHYKNGKRMKTKSSNPQP